jgi:hypothetical protein
MQELRCESKKHGVVIDDHTVEVKCDSRFCGARSGVIVLHRFDLTTGKLVGTHRYKEIRRK